MPLECGPVTADHDEDLIQATGDLTMPLKISTGTGDMPDDPFGEQPDPGAPDTPVFEDGGSVTNPGQRKTPA